jgi:hypothetical protein
LKITILEIEETAADLHLSRSGLFVMAVEEFLQRRRTRQLLDAINAAHADSPDEEEQQTVIAIRNIYQRFGPW